VRLTQLIGLKYGTDAVRAGDGRSGGTRYSHADYAEKPYEERNGYTFNDFNNPGIESALHRAIGLWYSTRSISANS